MATKDPKQQYSMWNSPRDRQPELLDGLDEVELSDDEVKRLCKHAEELVEDRAKAYRTPVTSESLRRTVD